VHAGKILLAVDGSTPARQTVDYAGRTKDLIRGLTVTFTRGIILALGC
jgi:hypothetical protein